MDARIATSEGAWIAAQGEEDVADGHVVCLNYLFECLQHIVAETTRIKFIETQMAVRPGITPGVEVSAHALFRETIAANREFWTAGERISLKGRLVMVKHGHVAYREQWSYLSAMPEEPDDATMASMLEESKASGARGLELTTGSRAAAIDSRLWDEMSRDPTRARINSDLAAVGLAPLQPEDARTWDSYWQYHDRMFADGYLPIWWVTSGTALEAELEHVEASAHARVAAIALGLSEADPGPYYTVEIPADSEGAYAMHKPTMLSGGYANNFCAVIPSNGLGRTARLESGEAGLIEAVMVPILAPHDRKTSKWRLSHCLGNIGHGELPLANTRRIQQRLKIEAAT